MNSALIAMIIQTAARAAQVGFALKKTRAEKEFEEGVMGMKARAFSAEGGLTPQEELDRRAAAQAQIAASSAEATAAAARGAAASGQPTTALGDIYKTSAAQGRQVGSDIRKEDIAAGQELGKSYLAGVQALAQAQRDRRTAAAGAASGTTTDASGRVLGQESKIFDAEAIETLTKAHGDWKTQKALADAAAQSGALSAG